MADNGYNVRVDAGEVSPTTITLRARPAPVLAVAAVVITLFANPAASTVVLRGATQRAAQFDAVSSSTGNGTNTVTWSHTASGKDRALIVHVGSYFADGDATAVTFNGRALTLLGRQGYAFNNVAVSTWGLVAPDFGTHDVVVTFAGPASANGFMAAVSAASVDQTNPFAYFASNAVGGASPPPFALTLPGANCDGLIVAGILDYGGTSLSLTSAGTTRASFPNPSFISSIVATQPGNIPLVTWTAAVSEVWSACGAMFMPTSSPTVGIEGRLDGGTLAALTLAGTGTVTTGGGVNGTLSQTLAALTASSAGNVLVSGSLSQTLSALTVGSNGTVLVSGQLAQTLAALTAAGTGGVKISGTLARTLADVTVSSNGTVLVSGALGRALVDVALASNGTVTGGGPVTGTLAVTLAQMLIAGSGNVPVWRAPRLPRPHRVIVPGAVNAHFPRRR